MQQRSEETQAQIIKSAIKLFSATRLYCRQRGYDLQGCGHQQGRVLSSF